MKIIGTGVYDANQTTTTNSLGAAILTRPEISANISNFFQDSYTAFSSLLARKKLVRTGSSLNTEDFKVIGNRAFKWGVKGLPFTKCYITAAPSAAVGYSNFGENESVFTITLNANYYSPNDRVELNDGETHLQIMDTYPVEVGAEQWQYQVRLVTNKSGSYIAAAEANAGGLLALGAEVGFAHTAFPEMSETGYEKNQYPEWRKEYMTIQRMQYSISGSAASTKVYWAEHNNQVVWFNEQEMDMMRRWAIAREQQLLFGKPSIDVNDNVYLKDLQGRDIISGSGVVWQGDPSLRYRYNTLTVKHLENVMQNMQLLSNGEGEIEIAVQAGQQFVWDFMTLMSEKFNQGPQVLFEGSGMDRTVNANFHCYRMGNVKLIVSWNKSIDAEWRATEMDAFGNSKRSKDAYFFALNTVMDNPNIELVALGNDGKDRAFVKKIIDGMSSPDENRRYASNSVDGHQVQILSETGIKLTNEYGIAQMRAR